MKINNIIVLIFIAVGGLFAQANEFENGSSEFDTPPLPDYSEAEIQKKIQNEMAIACSKNLCKIAGQDSHGSGWTVSFQIGYGGGNNSGGSGGTVIIGGNNNSSSQPNATINITYKSYQCHSDLLVTPSIYRFVNTYLYNMVNSDGSVKRNFSPADQTVILFYTTLLSKVESCSGGMR